MIWLGYTSRQLEPSRATPKEQDFGAFPNQGFTSSLTWQTFDSNGALRGCQGPLLKLGTLLLTMFRTAAIRLAVRVPIAYQPLYLHSRTSSYPRPYAPVIQIARQASAPELAAGSSERVFSKLNVIAQSAIPSQSR